MRLSIIVAMDKNQLIGKGNALPWHLPADLQYFKKTTMGKTVLMGRKTYDSIGKPLPNRRNIILSRTSHTSKNRETFGNIQSALDACKNEDEVFIIGGVSIYEQFLNPSLPDKPDLFKDEVRVDRLYITQVEGEFTGDAYFPAFKRADFVEISRKSHQPDEKNQYNYNFTILERQSLCLK